MLPQLDSVFDFFNKGVSIWLHLPVFVVAKKITPTLVDILFLKIHDVAQENINLLSFNFARVMYIVWQRTSNETIFDDRLFWSRLLNLYIYGTKLVIQLYKLSSVKKIKAVANISETTLPRFSVEKLKQQNQEYFNLDAWFNAVQIVRKTIK